MNQTEDIMSSGYGIYEFAINEKVHAIMNEVGDSAAIFDDTDSSPVKLPGKLANKYRGYVPWGNDNQLPYEVMQKIRKDEVMSQNKQFNTLTCYASGIRIEPETEGGTLSDEIRNFFKYNRLPRYFLEQCSDMKHFLFSVSVIILSKDGKSIVKLRHKEAIHTRFETCDPKTGKIEHLYYANWEDNTPKEDEIEIIPVLDICDPIGDLEERINEQHTKERKFAIVNTFPTAGNKYYPFPYYWSVFLSGWYDIKRMIPAGKKAKLKNQSGIKYHVEVNRDYWESICREEKITDPELKAARIKKERENIKNFCTGIENSGKVWISGFYQDPTGKETRMVRINLVDTTKEGGDWLEDSEEAANLICYADNIHPNLVGAALGKSKNNMSGSDKRELFTIKQALEKPYHDILLEPLFVIKEFNGWDDFKYDVPVITLTTLDKGKDAEENTLRKEE
ncbi:hypothetical protein SAMD00024442_6_48 [Candidatus Symbiothrix dinenymphae]|nr:hypothetical protein SAMD00024442_6_48 [Candidatus Symbiothrix dinenymphae]